MALHDYRHRIEYRQGHELIHSEAADALGGAILTGWALPTPGVPPDNPPGLEAALWPLPGALAALALAYWWGARTEARDGE